MVRYAEVSMPEGNFQYVDVSVPAPLDQPFTYSLPETLRHRVHPGSRIVVPFGPRKLTGVILRCHDDRPRMATREALRLIDSEPVLDAELLSLGRWIASYYCAPLGDVLRGMLPLASEIRRGKVWSLTDAGRDAARQLLLDAAPDDPVARIFAHARTPPAFGRLPVAHPAARRQSHPFAGAQGSHRRRTGADRARPLARAGRPPARGARPHAGRRQAEQARARVEGLPGAASRLAQSQGPGKHAGPFQRRRSLAGAQRRGRAHHRNRRHHGWRRARAAYAQPCAAGRLRCHSECDCGARVSRLPPLRRHRLRQDRNLPQRHPGRGGPGTRRAAAGAGNRPHARHGRPVLLALRRPRGHSAQRVHRCGALRAVAPHPLRRGLGGGGHTLRRVRARPQSRADRGR